MKRSLTLLTVVSLFVLACGAQPATAQPPTIPTPRLIEPMATESRFGIDYVFPLQASYRDEKWPMTLAQTGAEWVNFAEVSWKALEPNPPQDGVHTYDWSDLDDAVSVWQQYGFHITMSLRLSDGWFAGPIKYRPEGMEIERSDRLPADEYMDDYRDWIAALVERYDGDGEDDMPGLFYPILHYQVGNEYANPAFWTGTPDDYRVLLEETGQAAAGASPDVQIISNGIRWNDLFHDDPNAELFEERFAAFLEDLPSDVWREAWQRARYITELTVALADRYDILDAGGNGPFETASAGYMAWVQQELAKSGLTTTIWDMEARSEPRLTYNQTVHFHSELVIPDGEEILCAMKNKPGCAYDHDEAVDWYRAEQSRVLVKVFVTRFAAGFERVFMGMPNDWDKMLAALAVANPFIGLTDSDGDPWPAFYAFKLLVEKVDGFAQVEKMPAEPGVALYRFTFDDGRPAVWAAWLWEDQVRGMNDPLPTRQVGLDIPGPVTMYTIPTTGDTYETVRLAGGPQGLIVELSPEPVLFQEAQSRIYLPLVLKNYTSTPTPEGLQLQHVSTVTLTTDEEGGGARPELVYADGRFFVVYLGNILAGSGDRAFKVKVFDQNFTTEIAARDLVTSTAEYGGPTDIRVISDGESLYAFYEAANPQQGAHLFAAKYALTDDFPLLAHTAEPIATGPYWHDAEFGDETLDDPASVLGPDSVFVMTKIRAEITPDADTVYRLRELTTDLVPVGQPLDLDVSDVVDGPAQVNSLLYVDGSFYAALPTTIAPMCGPGGGPDVANHDVIMIRFDDDWTYDPASDVWTISSCPEVERYISGFDYADDTFYVTHHATPRTWTCGPGGPPPGPGPGEVVWLKAYDTEMNPLDAVKVSGDTFGNHPTVEVVGDKVYVAYAHKETQEATENVVVAIYQKVPREEGYQPVFCGEGS